MSQSNVHVAHVSAAYVQASGFQLMFVLLPSSCLLHGCCAVLCHNQSWHEVLDNIIEQYERFGWALRSRAALQGGHVLYDAHNHLSQGAHSCPRVHHRVYRLETNSLDALSGKIVEKLLNHEDSAGLALSYSEL